jgi:hypothetical protein
VAVAEAVPSFPAHDASVTEVLMVGAPGEFRLTVAESIHPFMSVTITEYIPALSEEILEVVAALLHR